MFQESSPEFFDEFSDISPNERQSALDSKRNSKNGNFWKDCAPPLSRIKSYNIVRERPGLVGSSDF